MNFPDYRPEQETEAKRAARAEGAMVLIVACMGVASIVGLAVFLVRWVLGV